MRIGIRAWLILVIASVARLAHAQESDAGVPIDVDAAIEVAAPEPVAAPAADVTPMVAPEPAPLDAAPTESFGASAHVHVATPVERSSAASDIAIDPRALRDVPRRDA